jgi:Leucine-rich repeat (LRR) protein
VRAPDIEAVARFHAQLTAARISVLEIEAPVSDLSPLAGLDHIQSLRLSCRARDLTPLQALPGLTHLHLGLNTVLGDPSSGLETLPGIRHLCVYGYIGPRGPLKLDWLRHFPGLTSLTLQGTPYRSIDLEGLRVLSQLQDIELSVFVFSDMRPLAELSALRSATISHSQIKSFRGLATRSP